jgi:hypothetical protein
MDLPRKKALPFTPLESPSVYGEMTLMKIQFLTSLESHVFSNGVYGRDDIINHCSFLLLIEEEVKTLPFLTGFTSIPRS